MTEFPNPLDVARHNADQAFKQAMDTIQDAFKCLQLKFEVAETAGVRDHIQQVLFLSERNLFLRNQCDELVAALTQIAGNKTPGEGRPIECDIAYHAVAKHRRLMEEAERKWNSQ